MRTETERRVDAGGEPVQGAVGGSPPRSRRPGAHFALAGVVLVAACVYATTAQLVTTPRVHPDELIYGLAGASLAEGDGLTIRGEDYSFGPVFPAIMAAILTLVPDRESAYALFRVANALLFALSAVPFYLVARRLLSRWWSVGVAALSVAIPSSMYVSLLMTESTAYLTYAVALYAIVLALERPTVARQVLVLAAVALAFATRAQLGVLFAAYLVGLALLWALARDRTGPRETIARIWPSLGALGLVAVVLLGRALLTGSSVAESVGAYGVLFRGYEPLAIVKWAAYHVADLEIYLAVVPLAVAPIVLSLLWRRARAGSEAAAAFVAAFSGVNAGLLLTTAAFASTEFGFDRLHDRNVFYLAPLWLMVLAIWLADGLPRPRVATGVGAALALALPVILPFRHIASDVGVDVVPSALWARVSEQLADAGPLNGRRLLVLAVVALVVGAALLPRRLWWTFPAAVLATFAITAVLAWERIVDAPEEAVFAGGLEKAWIDARLSDDDHVTKLYYDAMCGSALSRHALSITELFNATVDRAAYVGDSLPDGLPIERVDVANDGRLLLASGEPLVVDYAYTPPWLRLDATELSRGTAADLVLWEIEGPVSVSGARSNGELGQRC